MAGNLSEAFLDADKRERLKPEAQWEVEGGLALSALDVHRANLTRSAWYACLLGLFEDYGYLALPTAQVFPFDVDTPWPRAINGRRMDTYHRWMEVVIPGSLSGCPVITCRPASAMPACPWGSR